MINTIRNISFFLTYIFTILFSLSITLSVNAQTFPDGLVGLSSNADPDPDGEVYSINATTGMASPLVTIIGSASVVGLSYLHGTLYGSDLSLPGQSDIIIGSIDTDGTITFLSDQNGSRNWWGLASDDCRGDGGVLYAIDANNNDILTAQFPDGSVMTIGSGTGIDGSGMAYDDENDILYVINSNGLYTVSTTTGTSNFIGPTGISGLNEEVGLAYDETNDILYANVSRPGDLYTVNVNTGAATLVGSNGVQGIDGLAWLDDCPIIPAEINLFPTTATNDILTDHTVTSTVIIDNNPAPGILVTFEVISGPNAGQMSDPDSGECTSNDDCTTDVNGQVSWTYTGNKFPGTDTIVASFFDESTETVMESNMVEKIWALPPRNVPTLSEWGLIAMAGVLGIVGFMVLRRRKVIA